MNKLLKVVEADCRYFENLHNADRMLPDYLKVVSIPDTNGWYSLTINESLLFSGPIEEINIAVKTLCAYAKVVESL